MFVTKLQKFFSCFYSCYSVSIQIVIQIVQWAGTKQTKHKPVFVVLQRVLKV